ncbi:hypothetical protein HGM15179_017127, partial [Zosterops borbonicus]
VPVLLTSVCDEKTPRRKQTLSHCSDGRSSPAPRQMLPGSGRQDKVKDLLGSK